jgi:S-adenosylmethionine/arginine decarboxylase-like enzyme
MKPHLHLIVKADISKPPVEEDCKIMERWMSGLISDIRMKELAPPRARYCPVIGNRGMTVDAIIETSHTVIHTWDEGQPTLQLDVYTCSNIHPEEIFPHLIMFEPTRIEYMFIDRTTGLKLVDQSEYNKTMLAKAMNMFQGIATFWRR